MQSLHLVLVYEYRISKRGEVIAFKPNGNENSHYYMKRVIGLPGETVAYMDGELLIDGEVLEEEYLTTEMEDLGLLEDPITLASGEYFVLGDDRLNSDDFSTKVFYQFFSLSQVPFCTAYRLLLCQCD